MSNLTHTSDRKLVQELVNHYEHGWLNLEPGFQRDSVWREKDRAKLIESIIRNYPLPAIFLYRRHKNGQLVYDVIDGKQRLESIFMFMGVMRRMFGARVQLPGGEKEEWVTWRQLCKKRLQHLITGYSIPTIEVDGEFSDIVNVFVRINSTGKALTPQEKRHARYFNSGFLREANRIATRYQSKLLDMHVVTATSISRMKHVELVSELMLSMHRGDVLNKKTALDSVMSSDGLGLRDIRKAAAQTVTSLNRVIRMFPKLHHTRFCRLTDFYTITVLINKFEQERLILTDKKRNQLAWDLLVAFGTRVDEMREKQRRLQGAKQEEEMYGSYLMTVSQMTDDISQRQKREEILRGILGSLFAKKDTQRGFTLEQRRIIWNTTATRRCTGKKCGGKLLTWDDFTLDHIDPHSKGGRSRIGNATPMCRRCNSSKGNRRR